MLITKIYLAAMSRADLSGAELSEKSNFYFFVDEFQSFANKSFADILSEARKYKLNLTIAHQYIEQMEEEVRSAVFGNVGTMIIFRVGSFDAEIFEKEFAPQFTMEDIVNLGFAQVYLRLMVDGIGSKPFSATTILPPPQSEVTYRERVIEASRKVYAKPRAEVEKTIAERLTSPVVADKSPIIKKPTYNEMADKRDAEKKKVKPAPQEVKKDVQRPRPQKNFEQKPKPQFQQKPVSLDALKDKKLGEDSTKNKNELKSALTDLLKEKEDDTNPVPVKAKNEVPEDVLKKILE